MRFFNKDKKYLLFTQMVSVMLIVLLLILCLCEGFTPYRIAALSIPAVYFILVFFLQQKVFYPYILISAAILCYILPVRNFFPVILCIIYSLGRIKYSYKALAVYLVNLIIAASLREEGVLNRIQYSPNTISLAIHLLLILFTYVSIVYFTKARYQIKKLDLTDDEIKILEEYKVTKQLKAVTCFSKNTVTEKLKNARERNAIDTNAELLSRYIITTNSQ